MGQQWTSVDEKLPESKENVLAWCNDRLMVLAYGYVYEGDQNGYVWMNCYEEIDGDPYWDDNLQPTHWMPLPMKPQLESVIPPVSGAVCEHDFKPCDHPAISEFDKCTKCGKIR